ncbi:hypothetical protein BRC81_00150 [Halobacteriales archaeon QS_1_68_20]|nr:MAG: hypothetical protein BRC81_00150 [Halobacteriales archaeon QS_1_68_20]
MSYASDDGTQEVTADGIRVEKGFEAEEFPVPAMRFAIASERDEAVTVRISDDIPEDFSMDGVGFHPDYEGENWTAYEDNRVEYERTLQPGEHVVTVYGIRASTMEEVRAFLTDPTIEEVSPAGTDVSATDHRAVDDQTIQDIAPKESNQVVRDVLAGERETLPGMDDDVPQPSGTDANGTSTVADVGPMEDNSTGEADDDLELGPDEAEDLLGDLEAETHTDEESEEGAVETEDDAAAEDDDVDDSIDLGLDADDDGLELDVDDDAEEGDPGLELDDIPETDELEPGDDDGEAKKDADEGELIEDDDTGGPVGDGTTDDGAAADELVDASAEEETADPVADEPADNAAVAGSKSDDATAGEDEPTDDVAVDLDFDSDGEADDLETPEESEGPALDEEPTVVTPDDDPTADDATPGEADVPADDEPISIDDGPDLGTAADSSPVTGEELGDGSPGSDEVVDEPITDSASDEESASDDPEVDDETDSTDVAVTESGSVVSALVEEIQSRSVEESELEALRDALDVGETSEPTRSVDTRISRLESRLEEFDAYTDALREFIDDRGTAEEIIEGLESEMEDLRDDLSEMSGFVESNEDRVDAVSEVVDGLESDLASTGDDLSTLTARVDEIDAEFEALVGSVEDLETDVEDVESTVEDLRSEVVDVAEGTVDEELEELRSDLASLQEDVEEIVEWRGQLGEMFK